MREKIIKIIEELTDSTDINGNVDLIEEDILDSFAFIELIAKLEDEFNIEIQPTQIPGDTWRSGIAGDKAHTTVSNMMAQAYQVYKTKKQLELNGWSVVSKKVKDQVVLTCEQW